MSTVTVKCWLCRGAKMIYGTPCVNCKGNGYEVREVGDAETRCQCLPSCPPDCNGSCGCLYCGDHLGDHIAAHYD